MKISVVGGGYVGLVTGTRFAQLGHDVTLVEINAEKVRAINNGHPPIYENGLEVLLIQNAGKKLHASTGFGTIASADIVFVCVGTPPKPDGSADLSYIKSASSSVGTALKNNSSYCCIVVKSTVPPGTTEKIVRP
jgi:UDPglucose 6-dehydrogenase